LSSVASPRPARTRPFATRTVAHQLGQPTGSPSVSFFRAPSRRVIQDWTPSTRSWRRVFCNRRRSDSFAKERNCSCARAIGRVTVRPCASSRATISTFAPGTKACLPGSDPTNTSPRTPPSPDSQPHRNSVGTAP
jgi:hypothetical protein